MKKILRWIMFLILSPAIIFASIFIYLIDKDNPSFDMILRYMINKMTGLDTSKSK